MKLVIISNHHSKNSQDLVKECKAQSIECDIVPFSEIIIDTDNLLDNNFLSYDAYLFRGYNKNYFQAMSLARYLDSKDKVVIDRCLTSKFVPSKFNEALIYEINHITHPRTIFTRTTVEFKSLGFPVVIKEVDSQKGKGVRLCNNHQELSSEIVKNGGNIIIQQYVPIKFDIRALCVGNKVLGAIKRHVVDGDFRSNTSIGARAEAYQLSPAEVDLTLKAHEALGNDISGVDLAFDDFGKTFVIETNITPEWQSFQEATNVNVASEILNYVKGRVNNVGKY